MFRIEGLHHPLLSEWVNTAAFIRILVQDKISVKGYTDPDYFFAGGFIHEFVLASFLIQRSGDQFLPPIQVHQIFTVCIQIAIRNLFGIRLNDFIDNIGQLDIINLAFATRIVNKLVVIGKLQVGKRLLHPDFVHTGEINKIKEPNFAVLVVGGQKVVREIGKYHLEHLVFH